MRRDQTIDYLGIPGPIHYNNLDYHFAWSASPAKNYFKQEYLSSNDKIEAFDEMILIEALVTKDKLAEVVKIKLAELEERKKQDPVLNYQLFHNGEKAEFLLDFIVSEGKDKLSMVEWDAYRYKSFTDKAGHSGVMIFGFIRRETKNITDFLNSLGDFRKQQMGILGAYLLPSIDLQPISN